VEYNKRVLWCLGVLLLELNVGIGYYLLLLWMVSDASVLRVGCGETVRDCGSDVTFPIVV
jgi:hypothetical protein